MSWDYIPGRNAEGYPDPTAATAIANVQRSQRGLQSKRAGEHFEEMIAASLNWYQDKGVPSWKRRRSPCGRSGHRTGRASSSPAT